MLKLIKFLLARNSLLLFLGMELIAFIMILNNNLYLKYQTNDYKTEISGFFNSKINSLKKYNSLAEDNKKLLEENAKLHKLLLNKNRIAINKNHWDSLQVIPAFVITNQYQMINNIVLLDKGKKSGIKPKTGVIGSKGIIGITLKVSPHYTAVLSILNRKNLISVRPKNSKQFGFLKWDGNKVNIIDVVDLPYETKVQVNDTIVTAGNSNIFPKGLPVGKIIQIQKSKESKIYKIKIKTFEDFRGLDYAYVLINNLSNEYEQLKDSLNEF